MIGSLSSGLVGGATGTPAVVGTNLFQCYPFTIWDERLGSVGPGELEEGAFGGAVQNHGAVVFDGLGQVGPDGHLRNRFWNQRGEISEVFPPASFTSRFTVKRDGSESSSGSEANLQTQEVGGAWSGPPAPGPFLVNRAPKPTATVDE